MKVECYYKQINVSKLQYVRLGLGLCVRSTLFVCVSGKKPQPACTFCVRFKVTTYSWVLLLPQIHFVKFSYWSSCDCPLQVALSN